MTGYFRSSLFFSEDKFMGILPDIFYLCDPDKNTECTKEACGNDMCYFTKRRECSKDGKYYMYSKELMDFKEVDMNEIAVVAYNHDKDFKEYVDKYAKANELTLEEAMDHKIVDLYLQYVEENNGKA